MGCCGGIGQWWENFTDSLNDRVGDSAVGRYFKLKERRSKFTTELRAGTVTFLTMAYIMSVNANIIADTGGPCTVADCTGLDKSPSCKFTDPGYAACVNQVRGDLVTATAASSLLACFIMGSAANMPLALAPGMGLNAYFAYNVVGYYGTGNLPYNEALTAVFFEGVVFFILAVTGIRGAVIKLVPRAIMLATSAGIGLFLAFIGMQATQGLGIAVYSSTTVVTIGGCPASNQVPTYTIADPSNVCQEQPDGSWLAVLGNAAPNYACVGAKMRSPTLWLGIAGFIIVAVLMQRKVKGSIMIGIVFVTAIAWIPGHGASYLKASSAIPGGAARWENFKQVIQVPSISLTGAQLSFTKKTFTNGNWWLALFTFLYVDFLDTTGTLFSMANFMNNFIPGFVDEKKQFPRQLVAFSVDGVATVAGSLMGTSPIATYIESASGIRDGGRTGITALAVSFYFAISLFFVPVLSSIPPYAVGPALIIVGSLMVANVAKIQWDRIGQAIPAFLTLAFMPLTYSIAYGVIVGLSSYVIINGSNVAIDKIMLFLGHYIPNLARRAVSRTGSQSANSANSMDDSRHGDDFDLEYTYNPHRGRSSGSLKGTPDSSTHGPSAGGGAGAVVQMQRLQSSRNGFGFGRAAVQAGLAPADRSGRTTPTGGSLQGGNAVQSGSPGPRPPRATLNDQVRRTASKGVGATAGKASRRQTFDQLYGDDDAPAAEHTDVEKGENELTMRGLSEDQHKELGEALSSPFPQVAEEAIEFVPMRRDPHDDDEVGGGDPSVRRQLDLHSDRQMARQMDDTYQGSLRAGD